MFGDELAFPNKSSQIKGHSLQLNLYRNSGKSLELNHPCLPLIRPHSPWAMKALKVSHFSNSGPHVGVCGCAWEHAGKRESAQVNANSVEECGRAQSHARLHSHQIMAQRPNGA